MKMKDYVIILERRIQSLEDVAHEPQYHMNWNKRLEQIKENMSEDRGDVVLRPDSPVEATNRYAGYINIEHPKQIREHSCYIKED